MNLTQSKIDLAVLHKLYEHAEAGGEAETPSSIGHLLGVFVPLRRIELALEQLEARGEIERVYHPHYHEQGLWQISRLGITTVEKALKLPNSFIARVHRNGDQWLESDEAIDAKLSKNPRYEAGTERKFPFPVPTSASPTNLPQPVSSGEIVHSVNWTKCGAILTGLGVIVTILIAVVS